MGLTDLELVEQAKAGDRAAFHQLVDSHALRLYRLAAIMTGHHTDAQDLVQDTFLGAYEALPRFEGRSSFKTWLTGILIRQAALQRRQGARRRQMASLDHPDASEPAAVGRGASGGDWVARADARLDLMALMAPLSPEHREILVLRELEGLSYEQIAQLLDQPQGTVESRLFRARQALKAQAGVMMKGASRQASGATSPASSSTGQNRGVQ